MSTGERSNTEVIPPGAEKFTPPEIPDFQGSGPWLSVLSLLAFCVASLTALMNTTSLPLWSRTPFVFTAVGSGIGFLYELWLIASGRPYQLFITPGGRIVQWFRAAVLVLVFGSTYLAYGMTTSSNSIELNWIVAGIGLLSGLLGAMLLLRGPELLAAALFLIGFLGQLLLTSYSDELGGSQLVFWLLVGSAFALYSSVLVGSATPMHSTVFHLLGIAAVALLFYALQALTGVSLLFTSVPTEVPTLWLVGGVIVAVLGGFYCFPATWGVLRAFFANATWPLFYLIIAGGMRIPRPDRLSDLYRGKEDQLKPLKVQPYHVAHPRNLTFPVAVPSLDEALTLKVHALGFITRLVSFLFAVASAANRLFPFANIKSPIKYKPRMEPWSDGRHYWPWWLRRKIWIPGLGWFHIESGVQGPGFQPTPDLAIEAYHKGQLLGYLAEFGIAGALLEREKPRGASRIKLDFRFLEQYETKPDYEPYGGVAYFRINTKNKSLEVVSVVAPGSDEEISVNVDDAGFRHAEQLILASLYYHVVSGKHLVEIHMGLNLVEVALFNSFDLKKKWNHPVRMALYPHLFAHELAEELTTQNLLEDGAVFPQIFATTNAALMRHLNDRFSEYELGRDEDFEEREKVLLSGRRASKLEDVLPNSSLIWEKQYAAIWRDYAQFIVDATYSDDNQVVQDDCVQTLFANLKTLFHQQLPKRYAELTTRKGLVAFIAETMHHLIIRHEVYGTSGVRLSLDPRINKVQVPKDGRPPAIDEWRSLACVAMATSRVRYTKLMTNFSSVFADIDDENIRREFRKAHARLKSQLQKLENEFTEDGVDNYQTLRLLPSELDIGAGY